jgi:hypothetical protein
VIILFQNQFHTNFPPYVTSNIPPNPHGNPFGIPGRGGFPPARGPIPGGGRGGGFLANMLKGGGLTGGAPGAGGGLTNVQGMLNNVQGVLKMAQTVGPMVQQYGPLVKNIPALFSVMKQINSTDSDSTSSKSNKSSTPKKTNLKGKTKNKSVNIKDNAKKTVKKHPQYHVKESKPKLYLS